MPSSRPSSRRPASRPLQGPAARPAQRPGARLAGRSGPSSARRAAGGRPPRARFTSRAAVLVLVLVVLMVSYASSMRAYLEQRAHLDTLRAGIAESRSSIEQLEREKRRWQDPAYVEAQAALRFGWVMPGEIGFQVIDENGRPLGYEETLSDPGAIVVANEPQWWQNAWGTVVAAGNPEDVPVPVDEIEAPRRKQR